MTKLFSRTWMDKQLPQEDAAFVGAGNPDLADFQRRMEAAKERANAKAVHVGSAAFAHAVETLRKVEGINEKEFGKRTTLGVDVIQRLASAKEPPSLRIVSLIAKALNVKPVKLAAIAGLAERSAANDAVIVRYATLSSGMQNMSDDQKNLIAEWVKYMTED